MRCTDTSKNMPTFESWCTEMDGRKRRKDLTFSIKAKTIIMTAYGLETLKTQQRASLNSLEPALKSLSLSLRLLWPLTYLLTCCCLLTLFEQSLEATTPSKP
jgi:hypothetical protein